MRKNNIIGLKILIINADGLQIRPNEEAQWLMSVRSDLDKSLTLGIVQASLTLRSLTRDFVIRTSWIWAFVMRWKNIIGFQILIINTDGLQIRPNGHKMPWRGIKLIARGVALGYVVIRKRRPVRAKELLHFQSFMAFALTGREYYGNYLPRALPWASCFCPFGAFTPP